MRLQFKEKVVDNNDVDEYMKQYSSEPNLELMSLQFCSFLIKKKSKRKFYSYIDPL